MLTIKILDNNLMKLEKRVKDLSKSNSFVGYHKSQGIHSEHGLYYIDLIRILSAGYSPNNLPPRPIFKIAQNGYNIKRGILQKDLSKYFRRIKSNSPPISTDKINEDWSKEFGNEVFSIFGNSSLLAANKASTIASKGSNTPLVETSELRDNLGYSVNNKVFKPVKSLG